MADVSLIQGDAEEESSGYEGLPNGYNEDDGFNEELTGITLANDVFSVLLSAQSASAYEQPPIARALIEWIKTEDEDDIKSNIDEVCRLLLDCTLHENFLKSIPELASLAQNSSAQVPCLKYFTSDCLLKVISRNLGSSEPICNKAAQIALLQLMERKLLTPCEIEIKVCPTILCLAKSTEAMADVNPSIITLMSKLARHLGRDATERVFIERYIELCKSPYFYVRRACAAHIGEFCAIVGQNTFENTLLPCYLELCKDELYGTRISCAEVAMYLSCMCSPSLRKEVLTPAYLQLLADECRWVRLSAYNTLGAFISTFAHPSIVRLDYNSVGDLTFAAGCEFEYQTYAMPNIENILESILSATNITNRFSRTTLEEEEEEEQPDVSDKSEMAEPPLGIERNFVEDTSKACDDIDRLGDAASSSAGNSEHTTDSTDNRRCDTLDDKLVNEDTSIELGKMKGSDSTTKDCNVTECSVVGSSNNSSFQEIGSLKTTQKTSEVQPSNADSHDVNVSIGATKKDNVQDCSNSTSNGTKDAVIEHDMKTLREKLRTKLLKEYMQEGCVDNKLCEEENTIKFIAEKMKKNHSDSTKEDEKVMKFLKGVLSETKDNDVTIPEDELVYYNCYNFWYIKPEPIDSILPEGEKAGQDSTKVGQGDAVDIPELEAEETKETQDTVESSEKEPQPRQDIVPQGLVDSFVSMLDPTIVTDRELSHQCAYSMPAVVLTLGIENWPMLKSTVEVLAGDRQYKVRRTVAAYLHQLARILGPEIATEDLTPLFDGFIKDLDEVRIEVLKHLAEFLGYISPSKRCTYLPKLSEFLKIDHQWNWRFREELARQLRLAIPLFKAYEVTKFITPIAHELVCDRVAAVRESSLLLISEIIKYSNNVIGLKNHMLLKLAESFAHSKKWKRRQTFALLCSELLTMQALKPDVFATEIMPHLLDLSWDPVANVRLVVARVISRHLVNIEYFCDPSNQYNETLESVLERLQADKDRDVRQAAYVY